MKKEIKIGNKLVVKNDFRIIDIVVVLDIFISNSYGHSIYDVQSIGFGEKRLICFDDIIGVLDVIEGVNICEHFREKRK